MSGRPAAVPDAASKTRRGLWLGFGIVALAVTGMLTEAQAMAKMCLFSEVSGVVLDHGKPVVGARLTRSWFWHWKDVKDSDSTQTDATGAFRFPAVYGSSLFGSVLPHEPVVEQKILIQQGDQTYRAWVFAKGEYGENGELGGKPIKLVCRLENEPSRKEGVFGICELN